MKQLIRDIRMSLRSLLRNPGFTIVAVLSLALGIGPNTAVFTLFNAFLLRPLPGVENADELVRVYPGSESVSYPDYVFFRDESDVFQGLLAESSIGLSWNRDGRPERLSGAIVSGNYFDVLGIHPVRGRGFLPEEDREPNADAVAVIGYGFWQRSFGGQDDAVGSTLQLNGRTFTIVGVAPEDFTGGSLGQAAEVWVPTMMQPTVWPGKNRLENRRLNGFYMTGRVAPNVSTEAVTANLEALHKRLLREYPDTLEGWDFVVVEPAGLLHRSLRDPLLVFGTLLLVVVGLVLLIACANLANLLLARAAGLDREIAIRQAIGAGRRRIVSRLLVESTLLSLLGGAVGVLLALALIPVLVASQLSELPVPVSIDLAPDPRVLAFTVVLSLLTGLLFGLLPALRLSRTDLVTALKHEPGTDSPHRRRFGGRNLLVVGQIGFSLLLLIGAGLFIRSLQKAQAVDPGFDIEHNLVAGIDLAAAGYSEAEGKDYYQRLTERVRDLPAAQAAGLASIVPLTLNNVSLAVMVDGVDRGQVYFNYVSPGYFDAMGIDLVQGRDFNDQDREGSPPVAVISRTMAERFWPGDSAVGKQVRQIDFDGPTPPMQIVGVVEDSKYLTLGEDWRPLLFLPAQQHYQASMFLHVRTAGEPDQAYGQILPVLRGVDPNVALELRPAADFMGVALLLPRIGASLLGIFGLIGLLLTGVGVYGLMAYFVSQRLREIGIRLALGSQRREILGLVVGRGMRLAAYGIVGGLLAAFIVTRVISSLLYGVSPTDPVIFLGISALLAGVAFAATFVPARRASKVDPMRILRA